MAKIKDVTQKDAFQATDSVPVGAANSDAALRVTGDQIKAFVNDKGASATAKGNFVDASRVRITLSNGDAAWISKTDFVGAMKDAMGDPVGTFSTLPNKDANNIKTNGIYRVVGNKDLTNFPNNSFWGTLLVCNANDFVVQILVGANGEVYNRSKNNANTWSDWIRSDNFGYNSIIDLAKGVGNNFTALDTDTTVDFVIGLKGNVAKKISADDISKETELHGSAWGVVINPNSANSALEMVGNYNLWTEFKESIGRYQLSNDGSKAVKLDVFDSSKYHDGTAVDSSKGHIMVYVPDFYYKVETLANGNVILWMSSKPIGGHSIHTSGVGNGSWIGAYIAQLASGKLVSRSGVNPTHSRTISQFWADAQANGEDFGLSDYEQRKLMLMLYLSEYHNENSQAQLGYGMTGNGNNWVTSVQNATTGQTNSLGDGCGSVAFTGEGQTASGACHVSLFGIEDPYGWFWEMIQGCYFGNSENAAQNGTEMFLYEGNRMPSSTELSSKPNGDFRQLVRPTTSGYVYALQMGERFDILPARLGSGGWSDYHYANTTGQLLLWGGAANNGSSDGLVSSDSHDAFSYATSARAARLAFYGRPTVVSKESEL